MVCGALLLLLLGSASSASARGSPPQLTVSWNETDGNMSLSYGNLKVFGGPPTEYDTPAHGAWDPATSTYTQNSPKAPMNWTIQYSVDAAKAELQLSVTVHNGPEYSERGVSLWPINGKGGRFVYPANLTEPEFTGYCDPKALTPRVKMQSYVEGAVETSIVAVIPDNAANASLGWFIGHSQLEIVGLQPNEQRTVVAALRFGSGPVGTWDPYQLADDAYKLYGSANPLEFEWLDRSPIAMLFIAGGNHKTADNINAYNVGLNPPLNFSLPNEQERFRVGLAGVAARTIETMGKMAPQATPQAVILWDLEGEGDPWATYVGSPDKLPEIAPEFDGLADEFMRNISDGGKYRLGLTLRPQKLVKDPAYTPGHPTTKPYRYIQQELLVDPPRDNSTDVPAIAALLIGKMNYAIKRWNVTVFYIDTTGGRNGVYPATVFEIVRKSVGSDILILPEISTIDYYRWTTPLAGDIHGDVKHIWPLTKTSRSDSSGSAGAFAFNLMQNCCNNWNSTKVQALAQVAAECSGFLFDGWWWNPSKDPLVKYAVGNGTQRCPLSLKLDDDDMNSTALTVTDSTPEVGAPIPSDFFGVSSSYGDYLQLFGNKTSQHPGQPWTIPLLQQLKTCSDCAGPRIRINGDQGGAKPWWGPQYDGWLASFGGKVPPAFGAGPSMWIGASHVQALHDAAEALNGSVTSGLDWSTLLSGHGGRFPPADPFNTTLQTGMVKGIGAAVGFSRFREFEVANEPDLNSVRASDFANKTAGQNASEGFVAQWSAFARAIYGAGAPADSVQGGVFCCVGVTGDEHYILRQTQDLVKVWNRHVYPLVSSKLPDGKRGGVTVEELFSAKARDLLQVFGGQIPPLAKTTEAAGLRFIIGESQSVNMGGAWNVSDVFANALWTLDWAGSVAGYGASQLNLNFGQAAYSVPYSMFGCSDGACTGKIVRPQFLGMLAWNLATQTDGGVAARLLDTAGWQFSAARDPNVSVRMIRRGDGSLACVAVNFHLANATALPTQVSLQLPARYVSAKMYVLESKSGSATGSGLDVSFAGLGFDSGRSGKPVGKLAPSLLRGTEGHFAFSLRPLTAIVAILTEK